VLIGWETPLVHFRHRDFVHISSRGDRDTSTPAHKYSRVTCFWGRGRGLDRAPTFIPSPKIMETSPRPGQRGLLRCQRKQIDLLRTHELLMVLRSPLVVAHLQVDR
jgi:hypothetical protein